MLDYDFVINLVVLNCHWIVAQTELYWFWQSGQLTVQKPLWQRVEAADKMAVMNFSKAAAAREVGMLTSSIPPSLSFWAPPSPHVRAIISFIPSLTPSCLSPPILIAPCRSCSMPCLTCLRAAVTKILKRRRILHGFSLGPGTHWCTVWVCSRCVSLRLLNSLHVPVVPWAFPLMVQNAYTPRTASTSYYTEGQI